jgi:hypothetical protein
MRLSTDEQHRRAAGLALGLKNARLRLHLKIIGTDFPIGDLPATLELAFRSYCRLVRGWCIVHLYLSLQAPERNTVGAKQVFVE